VKVVEFEAHNEVLCLGEEGGSLSLKDIQAGTAGEEDWL
jgi:hypothetical protein